MCWFLYLLNLQAGTTTVCLFVLPRADLKVNVTWPGDATCRLTPERLTWNSLTLSCGEVEEFCSGCVVVLTPVQSEGLSCVFYLWKWIFSLRHHGNELLTSFVIESIKWMTERKYRRLFEDLRGSQVFAFRSDFTSLFHFWLLYFPKLKTKTEETTKEPSDVSNSSSAVITFCITTWSKIRFTPSVRRRPRALQTGCVLMLLA